MNYLEIEKVIGRQIIDSTAPIGKQQVHITNTVSGEWLLVHPLPYYSQCVTYIRQMYKCQCCCDTCCILRKWYSCCVSFKSIKNIEAFQSVHHVIFILCYNVLSDFFCLVFSLIRVRKLIWEDITQGKQ